MRLRKPDSLALWPPLAREAGLEPQQWRARPLARREDSRVARYLFMLEKPGQPRLVFKHEARPVRPAHFLETIQAHLDASAAFPDGVPEILAFDAETQTVLMRHAAGQPLSTLLEGQPLDAQTDPLRVAGALRVVVLAAMCPC